MDQERWDRLMNAARAQASIYGVRARVRALKLPPRTARRYGVEWAYFLVAEYGRRG